MTNTKIANTEYNSTKRIYQINVDAGLGFGTHLAFVYISPSFDQYIRNTETMSLLLIRKELRKVEKSRREKRKEEEERTWVITYHCMEVSVSREEDC